MYKTEEELKQILTKLRDEGCSRTELKEVVDEVCNNVKKAGINKNERPKKGIR